MIGTLRVCDNATPAPFVPATVTLNDVPVSLAATAAVKMSCHP